MTAPVLVLCPDDRSNWVTAGLLQILGKEKIDAQVVEFKYANAAGVDAEPAEELIERCRSAMLKGNYKAIIVSDLSSGWFLVFLKYLGEELRYCVETKGDLVLFPSCEAANTYNRVLKPLFPSIQWKTAGYSAYEWSCSESNSNIVRQIVPPNLMGQKQYVKACYLTNVPTEEVIACDGERVITATCALGAGRVVYFGDTNFGVDDFSGFLVGPIINNLGKDLQSVVDYPDLVSSTREIPVPGTLEELRQILDEKVLTVTFKKVADESVRTMTCTRNRRLVDPREMPKDVRGDGQGQISVFQLWGADDEDEPGAKYMEGEWKSFKFDRIMTLTTDSEALQQAAKVFAFQVENGFMAVPS